MVYTKDTSWTEKDKGMELLNGIMDRFSKEIGTMAQKMDSEYGDHLKAILMRENGWTIGNMDLEDSNIKAVRMLGIF